MILLVFIVLVWLWIIPTFYFSIRNLKAKSFFDKATRCYQRGDMDEGREWYAKGKAIKLHGPLWIIGR